MKFCVMEAIPFALVRDRDCRPKPPGRPRSGGNRGSERRSIVQRHPVELVAVRADMADARETRMRAGNEVSLLDRLGEGSIARACSRGRVLVEADRHVRL